MKKMILALLPCVLLSSCFVFFVLKCIAPEKIRYGFIDKQGNFVIEPEYDWASSFEKGIAQVTINSKRRNIDKTGKVIEDSVSEEIISRYELVRPEKEGLLTILQDRKMGFIDKTGNIVITPQFNWASSFSEGKCVVEQNSKFGYINIRGEIVIPIEFDEASDFADGLASVKRNNDGFFIDHEATIAFQIEKYLPLDLFSEEMLLVENLEGKKGFVDKKGSIVIAFEYEDARSFSEGLARVKHSQYWGYIDRNGNSVIKPSFSWLGDFSEGLARFSKNNRWGYLNKRGEILIKPSFIFAGDFRDGLAVVSTKN